MHSGIPLTTYVHPLPDYGGASALVGGTGRRYGSWRRPSGDSGGMFSASAGHLASTTVETGTTTMIFNNRYSAIFSAVDLGTLLPEVDPLDLAALSAVSAAHESAHYCAPAVVGRASHRC